MLKLNNKKAHGLLEVVMALSIITVFIFCITLLIGSNISGRIRNEKTELLLNYMDIISKEIAFNNRHDDFYRFNKAKMYYIDVNRVKFNDVENINITNLIEETIVDTNNFTIGITFNEGQLLIITLEGNYKNGKDHIKLENIIYKSKIT